MSTIGGNVVFNSNPDAESPRPLQELFLDFDSSPLIKI